MKRMFARRGLVAIAVVAGLVALSSSPASADPVDEISGTIAVGGETFVVGDGDPGDPEPPCEGSEAIDIEFAGNATAGTWTATGTIKAPFQLSTSATDWYQAEMTILSSSNGTYASSGASVAGRIDVRAVLQTLDPETCDKGVQCTVQARLIVQGTSNHSGSLPTPVAGDQTQLDATTSAPGGVNTFAVGGSCPVTLTTALVGKVVTANLILDW